MKKNWETTLFGIGTIVAAIAAAIIAYCDGDPDTNVNLAGMVAAITAGFGLIRARDGNKSSRTVGAK